MRRLIFLLFFFVLTVLQPALSGMLELAYPSNLAPSAAIKVVDASRFQSKADDASTGFAHIKVSSSCGQVGCESAQPCNLCNVCQACHQAVMIESRPAAPGRISIRPSFPSVASSYFSAERAPSFKPPIL